MKKYKDCSYYTFRNGNKFPWRSFKRLLKSNINSYVQSGDDAMEYSHGGFDFRLLTCELLVELYS